MPAAVLHGMKDLRIEERPIDELGPNDVCVKIRVGGICGSDLHYFQHGQNGTIKVREPMTLGHEIAGTIESWGDAVEGLVKGRQAAVNPSNPCGHCKACRSGKELHCKEGSFLGSAMRFPHTQGGFSSFLIVDRKQVFPVEDDVNLHDLVFAEPLAVCLHALSRAGELKDKSVLITGAGPIGLLLIMLAKHNGAKHIIATDISDSALSFAQKCGADKIINVSDPQALEVWIESNDLVEIAFECSGHPSGVAATIQSLKTCGILVQVGMLGSEVTAPLGAIVVKEIDFRGTFRFDREFSTAVELLTERQLDVSALVTHHFAISDALNAFVTAGQRDLAMKVQLIFNDC
ncbi:L-idonate 5-dehydrogenase [Ochrobactrum sp. EDr1-4]|uniref:L-idonate 5-dehydrogenase n=1 Tax=Ochrobactrum sp. EDr1-4 TaxID=3368622 RepID=UPI003BA2A741